MSKVIKRIRKQSKSKYLRNAVVLGTGMGILDDLLENYATVFVFSPINTAIKRKNLIFRESTADNQLIPDVDLIVVDRDRLEDLSYTAGLWAKYQPFIIIEGADTPSPEYTGRLVKHHYLPVEKYKTYQFWKITK